MSTNAPVLSKATLQYRRRKPQYGPYYQCIEDYHEEFNRSYDRNFSQKYGYLRPHIEKVIFQYLDCGILHNGFARIKFIWGAPHIHFYGERWIMVSVAIKA